MGRFVKTWRLTCVIGSVLVVAATIGSGSAFAANHPASQTKAQWQAEIGTVRTPGGGCYHASYPSLQWHATRCLVAPDIPFAPRIASRPGGQVIGNGSDYSAQVSGTISRATGTFSGVTSKTTEKGQINASGSQVKNAFSLQLNSEFFSTPVCSGSPTPSKCEGWQQFVYAFHASGSTNLVFMQYWLLYWDTTCPSGWFTFNDAPYTFCYKNSPATAYGSLPANGLGKIKFVGQATSGGNDQVTLSSTSGGASTASNPDTVLDLASVWNTTEWGIFGDAGGGQANFGAKTTIEAVTAFKATSSSAPKCVSEGFTGETNNLKLTHTPAISTASSPTMASEQTNAAAKSPSCAVKS